MRTPSSSLLVLLCVTLALGAWPRAVHAQAAEQVQYYHTDAIGSVRMITDASGNVVARYDYLPFGQPWPSDQEPEPRRFAGYERELTTGSSALNWEALDYAGARYYSGQTGRFTTVDPVILLDRSLADPQSWNRYVYVRNNPLTYIDPDGRWWQWLHRLTSSPMGQRVLSHPVMQRLETLSGNLVVKMANLMASPTAREAAHTAVEFAADAEIPASPIGGVARAATGALQDAGGPLLELLSRARRVGDRLQVILEDGTKVLFRRDVGRAAHPIGPRYPDPVDHWNIELHSPVPGRPGRFEQTHNWHVILDSAGNPIEIF